MKLVRAGHHTCDVLRVRFALERLLYRLSMSALRDQFILKGGLLVTLWLEDDNRVPLDADFLAFGDASMARMIADFDTVMATGADDGLAVDVDDPTDGPIRPEAQYGGMSLSSTASLKRTRGWKRLLQGTTGAQE